MIYRAREKELMCLCFIAVEVYKGRSGVSKELWPKVMYQILCHGWKKGYLQVCETNKKGDTPWNK
jgi:hypothetical protein